MGLGLWFVAGLYLVAMLSVGHLATFSAPDRLAPLVRLGASQRRSDAPLLVLHLIAERCSCTEGLFRHLLERGPAPGIEEHIVFISPSSTRAARALNAGFPFTAVESEMATTQLGLSAAPVMVVLNAAGQARYAGGYFDHPSASVALDQRLLSRIVKDIPVEPLPIFGCAVKPELMRELDPLGLTG